MVEPEAGTPSLTPPAPPAPEPPYPPPTAPTWHPHPGTPPGPAAPRPTRRLRLLVPLVVLLVVAGTGAAIALLGTGGGDDGDDDGETDDPVRYAMTADPCEIIDLTVLDEPLGGRVRRMPNMASEVEYGCDVTVEPIGPVDRAGREPASGVTVTGLSVDIYVRNEPLPDDYLDTWRDTGGGDISIHDLDGPGEEAFVAATWWANGAHFNTTLHVLDANLSLQVSIDSSAGGVAADGREHDDDMTQIAHGILDRLAREPRPSPRP